MPERDAHDTDLAASESGPLATPRVSGEVSATAVSGGPVVSIEPPASSTRHAQPEEAAALSEPSDTLLSAGKPAARLEVLLDDHLATVDDRIAEVDMRLRDLDTRLLILEQKKSIKAPEPRQKPWLWIAFLIALIVVFQLLRRVR
jgi:hypothetical protein